MPNLKMRYSPNEEGYKSKTIKVRMSDQTVAKLDELVKKEKAKNPNANRSEIIRNLIENAK